MFFKFDEIDKVVLKKKPSLDLSYIDGDMDAPITVKYALFPVEKNTFTVRFENIGDKFDNPNMNGDYKD